MKIKKKSFPLLRALILISIFTILLSACGSEDSESDSKNLPKNISMGTQPSGSAIYNTAAGLGKVLSNHAEMNVSVKPQNGPEAYMPLLNKGELDLITGPGPDIIWATRGEQGYEKAENMRLLVRGNAVDSVGLTVRKDSDIKTVADLEGKRVGSDYGGIQGHKQMEAQLNANGLTWDDVKEVPVSTTVGGMEALRNDRIDATFGLSPFTPATLEAHERIGLRALNFFDDYSPDQIDEIPQEKLDELEESQPGAKPFVYNEGFITEDTIVLEWPLLVVTSTHLSDEAAYELVKTLWEDYKELHPIFSWLEQWEPDVMFDPDPVLPYHPGSIKFFKEMELWNDEMEEKQQELLEQIGE